MALSPENHALLMSDFGWAVADDAAELHTLVDVDTEKLDAWLNAAHAQGRASLEVPDPQFGGEVAPITVDQRRVICAVAVQRPAGHGYLHYALSYEALAASLEERVRLLEEGLRDIDGACSSFCDSDVDFVSGQVQVRIRALLSSPGERENG
ncbi:MAG: hypothetical protein J7521_20135 [Caulobacter sp.]|nr:hypothetical protein [Caulobacter sp.]